MHIARHAFALTRRVTFNHESDLIPPSCNQRVGSKAGSRNTWESTCACQQLIIEGARFFRRISIKRRIDRSKQHVTLVETGVDRAKVLQGSNKQRGAY